MMVVGSREEGEIGDRKVARRDPEVMNLGARMMMVLEKTVT